MVQGSFSGLGRPGVNAKPEENCQLFFDGEYYIYIYIERERASERKGYIYVSYVCIVYILIILLHYINCQNFFDGEATGLIRGLQH